MIGRLLAGAAMLGASGALAAPVTIHAGRLMAVPGQAVRGPSTIVVDNGRIVSVTAGYQPASGQLIDLRDKTVLPGLIDAHVHIDSDRAGNEGQLAEFTESVPLRAFEAQWNGMKTLRAGFTTVRNLGDGDSGASLAYRDAIARGWVQGPRIVSAGQSISTTGGHMDGRNGTNDEVDAHSATHHLCDGPADCRRAVRLQVSRGADVIKIATTGGVNSGTGLMTRMEEDEAQALIRTAHSYGKKVAVHSHGRDGTKLALRNGADSIEHGTDMDDETVRLFKQAGACYVPTLSTVNGYLERLAKDPNAYPPAVKKQIDWRIGITGKSLEKAYPAGVKICFGTDAGVSKHGRNADEFEWMVKHGMPAAQAIKAATVNNAELLGLASEIGTIEPGKSADIIAVAGDPLADVRALKTISFVMARGAVVTN
ncbi:imidazolonepropionase-like amidohydrolase [Sphingomonas kaistensis]|uniref:Imidazolonepropionase-like amidohydrolase n=1 Tax=Sphingomonas kaistensis TaxID=298708 RepID=A0A7X5Y5C3_9SPHN|nr:amidohydrolase family protein [Sphingomonas kaistensis]NJC05488.1 imidazolonepropionase-like amidohydrolase [Sphingomonas kaistensis]